MKSKLTKTRTKRERKSKSHHGKSHNKSHGTKHKYKTMTKRRRHKWRGGDIESGEIDETDIQSNPFNKPSPQVIQQMRDRERQKMQKIENADSIKSALTQTLQNRDINFSKMLQLSCKNPDNCLALGKYDDSIKHFFEDFRKLSYIDKSKVKRIGTPSANGFIIELPFHKLNYTAYTVLKCSSNKDSDNLFYEYYVGKFFINKYIKKLPSFVETYDLYEFSSPFTYNQIKTAAETNALSSVDIASKIRRINAPENLFNLFNYSCLKNKMLCVLIQHFDDFKPFSSAINNEIDNIKYDLYNLMYQVYFPLCVLGMNYTHYDLHANNVFLYKPFKGKECILMRYHRNNKIYEFKSEYIVKIIDYGRNYFYNGKISTPQIMKQICRATECMPSCGENVGYATIKGSINDPNFDFYWIDPSKPNMSHDLRLMTYELKDILIRTNLIDSFTYQEKYGTPEDMGDRKNIKSIFDIRDFLEWIMPQFNPLKQAKKYDATWKVIATMDIYDDDRDYEFVILPDV